MKNSFSFLILFTLSLFMFSCSDDSETNIDVKEPSDSFTLSASDSFDLVLELSDTDGITRISIIVDELDIIIEEEYDSSPLTVDYSTNILIPEDAAKAEYELHISVEDAARNGVSKILDFTIE